jgi:gamma-glutamylcyclotransferase (GGCT)/AIG2-like uncharacterized protein YtfP
MLNAIPVFLCCNFRKTGRWAHELPVPYLTKGTAYGTMWDLRDYAAVYFKPTTEVVHGEVYLVSRQQLRSVESMLDVMHTYGRKRYGAFTRRRVAVTLPDGTQIVAFGYEYISHTESRLNGAGVPRISSGDWRKYRGK